MGTGTGGLPAEFLGVAFLGVAYSASLPPPLPLFGALPPLLGLSSPSLKKVLALPGPLAAAAAAAPDRGVPKEPSPSLPPPRGEGLTRGEGTSGPDL